MRILILGGYGVFGGRLAELLSDDARVTLLIAGRSRARAEAFCAALRPGAARQALAFDRDGDLAAQLAATAADLLVDASGPFQAYGGDPYRVVAACIARGISYLDLADGADFVLGIARHDQAARARGVYALSGASSFPVLTAAVVRHLAQDWRGVNTIAAGIAPSPYAGVGLNVIRAIASYAGKRVPLRRDGRSATGRALIDSRRFTIAVPGGLPLRSTRFSLVDVPDLALLPALWPEARTVWTGAGPVPEILHRLLSALAGLVRLRVLPSLLPLARLLHWAANRLRWGEDRGGMFVAVTGRTEHGAAAARTWHLVADGGDGPYIPAMAAAAIIRNHLAGTPPATGARPATQALSLADYETMFADRAIRTGIRATNEGAGPLPLYRRVLGNSYDMLPAPLRRLHDIVGPAAAAGTASVTRGNGMLARLVAACAGFPRAGENVSVQVAFRTAAGGETWRRTFAGRSFASAQEEGSGRWQHLIVERFGPLSFALALVVEGGRLRLVMRGWRALGVPMPVALAPRIDSFEHAEDGRFNFHVEIGHRLTGPIVCYRGWLAPVPANATSCQSRRQ